MTVAIYQMFNERGSPEKNFKLQINLIVPKFDLKHKKWIPPDEIKT